MRGIDAAEGSQTVMLSTSELFNEHLDFSKIETGKLDLDNIDFSLRDNLSETIKTMSVRAHEKGLELAFHVSHDVPDSLFGDPGRLRQMIVNLAGNAIKFTDHGEVVVEVSTDFHSGDEIFLHFAVSDTGIGIPLDKQAALFGAFAQADGSTSRNYGGTGLGLAITSQLVEKMGGRLWVESLPSSGSTFHFTVHLGVQKITDSKTLMTPAEMQGLRVLVVDNNATNCGILDAIDPVVVSRGDQEARSTDCEARTGVLDRSALLSQFGGDLELLQRIVELFLEDAGAMLSSIHDSIVRHDSRSLERAAHKLKGSAANFHAGPVIEAAQRLETIGHERNLSGAKQALAVLEKEMRKLEPLLIELKGDDPQPIA